MLKTCFKCHKTKELDLFYKHPQMADGHLNKCKKCAKKDSVNRYHNPKFQPVVIGYERRRQQTDHRIAKQREYRRLRRERSPGKAKANNWVANAIRDGRLIPKPCEVCGKTKVEAHHKDYRKPQDVQWYCFKHHREVAHGQKTYDYGNKHL